MRTFWDWMRSNNRWRGLAEAVEQQKDRLAQVLQKMLPNLDPAAVQRLIAALSQMEAQLTSPEDIRKSATISKFVKGFKPNPAESAAHTVDRFRRELQDAVVKANAKGKTPEQVAEAVRQELRKALPEESPEVIEDLFNQVQKGARVQDVINAYKSRKNAVGRDLVVLRKGGLELIAINTWREDGTKEKHIDQTQGLQACHPLLKGTKWCVRFQDYFSDYTSSGPLYLVRENGHPLVLGHKDSPWLDVNDEPPGPEIMGRVAPFVIESNISPIAVTVVRFLPNPVQDVEALLASGRYKDVQMKMRRELLGQDYLQVANGPKGLTIKIEQYKDLNNCLDELKMYDNNTIEANIESADEWISEAASDSAYRSSVEDLVSSLDREANNMLEQIFEARHKAGQYGKTDDWDEITIEELVDEDDEIKGILINATQDSLVDETFRHFYRSIMSDLQEGDGSFWVDTDSWTLCILAEDVNERLHDNWNEYDWGEDSITSEMKINVPQPNLSLDFSDKIYNDAVKEELRNLK